MAEIRFKAYMTGAGKGMPDKNGIKFRIKMRSTDKECQAINDIDEEVECDVIIRPTGGGLPDVA